MFHDDAPSLKPHADVENHPDSFSLGYMEPSFTAFGKSIGAFMLRYPREAPIAGLMTV